MSIFGIRDAFALYGATLRNVQWSVSAWAPDGALVVSLWKHHSVLDRERRVLAFTGSANRWKGAGNIEFRENLTRAFEGQSLVRLIVVNTINTADEETVDDGTDASTVKKEFYIRDELVGKVTEWDGVHYALEFVKA